MNHWLDKLNEWSECGEDGSIGVNLMSEPSKEWLAAKIEEEMQHRIQQGINEQEAIT